MLSAQQKTCIALVVGNLPVSLKDSPIIMDVADESMRHIMGGDPLESLFLKSIRQVVTNYAKVNQAQWVLFLKNNQLDNFFNCFLNKSPELMMSLLDHCAWAPSEIEKEAKITIKTTQLLAEVDNKTLINVVFEKGIFEFPIWIPHILRRFCKDGINKINIQFEGSPSENDLLHHLGQQLFKLIQNTNFSERENMSYPAASAEWKYTVIKGSVCFSAHSKRKGGAMVFAKFNRCQGNITRDVNEILKTDFI